MPLAYCIRQTMARVAASKTKSESWRARPRASRGEQDQDAEGAERGSGGPDSTRRPAPGISTRKD